MAFHPSHLGARASSIAFVSLMFAGCMAADGTGSTTDPGTSNGTTSGSDQGTGSGAAVSQAVSITNLSADQPGMAANLAPSLVNAWGIVAFDGMFWVADNATGKVSILDGKGAASTGTPASDAIDLGKGITGVAATGVAAGDTTTFQIHAPAACMPAMLIFASENGTLIGVNPALSTSAGFVVVDRSNVGAIYKGVAVTQGPSGPLVLAADFHNARIDVFDANFSLVNNVSFTVPATQLNLAPFNVMTIDNSVYVAFAQPDANQEDEVAGAGLGMVAAFDTSGTLRWSVNSDSFNAPWGMVLASDFAPFPNALLVGNFGDGHITAIDPTTNQVLGQLMDASAKAAAIDGLWGLAFGAGVTNAQAAGLYFTAGPDDEMHGAFGVVMASP